MAQAPARVGSTREPNVSQRQHILGTALELMAQRGVDGTSMRDLASAAGLNVASLYHYFPSKRDLLVAVLEEHGFTGARPADGPATLSRDAVDGLDGLLDDMLQSMLEVEDFIRLMLGEVLRGDETARAVGTELFEATRAALEEWLANNEAELCEAAGAAATASMLRALIVGLFFEHVAGVLEDDGDPAQAFTTRARQAAAVLRSHR